MKGRGLRWCRSCRHWTRHRRVGRCLVCVPCAERAAEYLKAGVLAAAVTGGTAQGVRSAARPSQAPLPAFDFRERAAGAHLEDRAEPRPPGRVTLGSEPTKTAPQSSVRGDVPAGGPTGSGEPVKESAKRRRWPGGGRLGDKGMKTASDSSSLAPEIHTPFGPEVFFPWAWHER